MPEESYVEPCRKCAACGASAHPASGCEYSEHTIICGRCVRETWAWIEKQTHRKFRVGPRPSKKYISFYGLGAISRDEMQRLVAAWHAGNDATSQPQVQAMVAAETARIQQAFAQLPIQVQFVEHDPYASFEEMRDQVQSTGTMLIYMGGSSTPLWDEQTNWMARAVHDWDHIVKACDFSMEGEAAAFRHAAQCRPGLAPLYMSEVMLQAALANVEGGFAPEQKLVILPEHLQRYAEQLKGLGAAPTIPPEGIVNLVWLTAGLLRVTGSPEATIVHLAAGGVDEQTAMLAIDAANMLNEQIDQHYAGQVLHQAAAGRPEPEIVAGLGRTQWVDQALSRSWPRIAQMVPPQWMPTRIPDLEESSVYRPGGATAVVVEEYGCGHYGCVAPTSDPSVVLKITTDYWEAQFARSAMELAKTDSWPEGIVQYFQVLQPAREQLAGSAIYLLWREEAYDIGAVIDDPALYQLRYFRDATRVVLRALLGIEGVTEQTPLVQLAIAAAGDWAVEVTPKLIGYVPGQMVILPGAWPGTTDKLRVPQKQKKQLKAAILRSLGSGVLKQGRSKGLDLDRVALGAVALQTCRLALVNLAGGMAGQHEEDERDVNVIASVLNYYIDNGWLLGDVHGNNIGLVNDVAAITDPGVAIPLTPENLAVDIPTV